MRLLLTCLFLLNLWFISAQDLTGKWVIVESEKLGFYEELNLVATNYGNEYYGHTYDTENNGFCRYWLKGTFNGLTFNATEGELIDKSFNHYPSIMKLTYEKDGDNEYLVGLNWVYTIDEFFGIQEDLIPNFVRYKKESDNYKVYEPADDETAIKLHDHDIPETIEEIVEDIVIEVERDNSAELERIKKEEEERKRLAEEQLEKERLERERIAEQKRLEEEKRLEQERLEQERLEAERIAKQKEEEERLAKIAEEEKILKEKKEKRTDRVIGKVEIKGQREIEIEIWDYGKEDNDIVTIFANDEIIAKNVVIKSESQKFKLKLDPNVSEYRLLFLANNLGDIPPNSARIKINYENKGLRYKLFTDEENNAVITIKNRP